MMKKHKIGDQSPKIGNHRKSGITEIKKGLFSGFLGSSIVVGVEPKQKITNYSGQYSLSPPTRFSRSVVKDGDNGNRARMVVGAFGFSPFSLYSTALPVCINNKG